MKLKILKDLDIASGSAWLIKQEAIKWVKFQEDIQNHNPNYANEYRLNIQWIKNFFNITEDDLK